MTENLKLKSLTHPAVPGNRVEVFRDADTACLHIRDHLLTAPECFAWALVDPMCGDLVDLDSFRSRLKYLKEATRSQGASAQDLYNLYFEIIANELRDAKQLNWYITADDGSTIALGTGGVLTIVQGAHIKTAFLPGQGSPGAVKRSQDGEPARDSLLREGNGNAREKRGRRGRGRRRSAKGSYRRNRNRNRKDTRYEASEELHETPEELLYYKVFRPAVQFIRDCPFPGRKIKGERPLRQYGLLKKQLPPMGELSFENWLELRREVRGERRRQS